MYTTWNNVPLSYYGISEISVLIGFSQTESSMVKYIGIPCVKQKKVIGSLPYGTSSILEYAKMYTRLTVFYFSELWMRLCGEPKPNNLPSIAVQGRYVQPCGFRPAGTLINWGTTYTAQWKSHWILSVGSLLGSFTLDPFNIVLESWSVK